MNVLIIHGPGHVSGPCKTKCTHPHCWHLIQEAAIRCAACGEDIGYNRSYVRKDSGEVYHTECVNDADVGERR